MPYIRNIEQIWLWIYLSNAIFHFDFTMLLKIFERKKEDDKFPKRKTEKKIKNSVTTMISVDGEIIFRMKLKLKGNCFNKSIEKDNFKKCIIDLIEANDQMNMTADHSFPINNLLKSHLNAKSFSMFLAL